MTPPLSLSTYAMCGRSLESIAMTQNSPTLPAEPGPLLSSFRHQTWCTSNFEIACCNEQCEGGRLNPGLNSHEPPRCWWNRRLTCSKLNRRCRCTSDRPQSHCSKRYEANFRNPIQEKHTRRRSTPISVQCHVDPRTTVVVGILQIGIGFIL